MINKKKSLPCQQKKTIKAKKKNKTKKQTNITTKN